MFDGSHILFDGFMWFEGGFNLFSAKDSGDFFYYSLDERDTSSVIRGLVIRGFGCYVHFLFGFIDFIFNVFIIISNVSENVGAVVFFFFKVFLVRDSYGSYG